MNNSVLMCRTVSESLDVVDGIDCYVAGRHFDSTRSSSTLSTPDVSMGLHFQRAMKSHWHNKPQEKIKPLKKLSLKHKLSLSSRLHDPCSSSKDKHKLSNSLLATHRTGECLAFAAPVLNTHTPQHTSVLSVAHVRSRVCVKSLLGPSNLENFQPAISMFRSYGSYNMQELPFDFVEPYTSAPSMCSPLPPQDSRTTR